MVSDDLKKPLTDWGNLFFEIRDSPDKKTSGSLSRNQMRRHPWMKVGVPECNRTGEGGPNETCEWLRERVNEKIEPRRLEKNRINLKSATSRYDGLALRAASRR